ncbi:MAG: hypothetical protein F4Y20_06275, partial [Acidobacteria bacterium]|nr:hypothetical protein [Acidobacteriota bacterium]
MADRTVLYVVRRFPAVIRTTFSPLVRRLVHGMGYRYRLHAKELPGRPDLVFRPRRKVIFVHGCFWHRHVGCPANRLPTTRREFWRDKLDGNARRDRRNEAALE